MTILCYHTVEPAWESSLAVTPEAFSRQVTWLRANRRVVPVHEALSRLDSRGRLPRGEVALTFDDGFAGLHEYLLPLVRREPLPATVFLVAQTLTEAGQEVDWVDDPGSHRLTTLTLDQILEMQACGVDFQSHSWAHRDLTGLSTGECVRDLRDSREMLSDVLGRRVTMLAYPRGLHDAHVRQAAARAGYTSAFALPVTPEEPDRFAVPRVGIWRSNGQVTLRIKASRSYLTLRTSERGGRTARRARRALSGRRRAEHVT